MIMDDINDETDEKTRLCADRPSTSYHSVNRSTEDNTQPGKLSLCTSLDYDMGCFQNCGHHIRKFYINMYIPCSLLYETTWKHNSVPL